MRSFSYKFGLSRRNRLSLISVLFILLIGSAVVAATSPGSITQTQIGNSFEIPALAANSVNSASYSISGVDVTAAIVSKAYKFVVFNNATGTYAVNGVTGAVSYSSTTNASYVINSALGALTVGRTTAESVLCKGNFSLTHSIVMPDWATLYIDGEFYGATGLANDIIRNSNPTAYNVGVSVIGIGAATINGGHQTVGNGIEFNCTTTSPAYDTVFPTFKISNLYIHKCAGSAVAINFYTSLGSTIWITDVSAQENGGDEFYLDGVYDSRISGGLIGGSDDAGYAIYGQRLSCVEIKPNYINGHSEFYNSNHIDFSCQFVDNSGNFDTIELKAVQFSRFHDTTIRCIGGTDNTYSAIQLSNGWGPGSPNCTDNVFSNMYIGTSNTDGSIRYKYGIEETDAGQIYNLYLGITGRTSGTATIRVLGTGSEYDASSIIGTIDTS
jgi:hypothetical protein